MSETTPRHDPVPYRVTSTLTGSVPLSAAGQWPAGLRHSLSDPAAVLPSLVRRAGNWLPLHHEELATFIPSLNRSTAHRLLYMGYLDMGHGSDNVNTIPQQAQSSLGTPQVIGFDLKAANMLLDRSDKHDKLPGGGLAMVLQHSPIITNLAQDWLCCSRINLHGPFDNRYLGDLGPMIALGLPAPAQSCAHSDLMQFWAAGPPPLLLDMQDLPAIMGKGENTMEGIKTRAARLYRQLALPNPPLAAPVVHPAWDSPLDWTLPYCTVRTVVCTTEEDTLFWRTILAAQMTVTEVPKLPGQAAMLTGLSTQQEKSRGLLAALLAASARAADLAMETLGWLPPFSLYTRSAPARSQSLTGCQAILALKALIPTSAFAKSAAVLQMLIRVGCRVLGPLQGFLPTTPSQQPPSTQQQSACTLKIPAAQKGNATPLARCFSATPSHRMMPPALARCSGTFSAIESKDSAELGSETTPLPQTDTAADHSGSPKKLVLKEYQPMPSATPDLRQTHKAGDQDSNKCTPAAAVHQDGLTQERDEAQRRRILSLQAQLKEAQATTEEQDRQLNAQSTIIRNQTKTNAQKDKAISTMEDSFSTLQRQLQAARDDKARLEGAVISAGRQLKKAMSQRDSLVANMEKAIAQETARNLETLYGPLVDGYRKRCMCLEDQLRHVPPPRHTCGPACPPQPVPEQKKGAARGPPPGFTPEELRAAQNLPTAAHYHPAQHTAAGHHATTAPPQSSYPPLPFKLFG